MEATTDKTKNAEAEKDAATPDPAKTELVPTDDLVTTQHMLRTGRQSLAYTATPSGGEVLGNGEFKGHQPRQRSPHRVHARR